MKTAARDPQFIRPAGQIADHLAAVDVINERAERDLNAEIIGLSTRAAPAHAGPAVARAKQALMAKINQRAEARVRQQIDIAAIAAIAAVRPAFGDEFFPPETQAAVAALARLNPDGRLVNKLHGRPPLVAGPESSRGHKAKTPPGRGFAWRDMRI